MTPGRKSMKWLLFGVLIGMVLSTALWYWILPIRTQRVMMFEMVNIMWYVGVALAVWVLVYYGGSWMLRFAFMEQFRLTTDVAPRYRGDKGRIKLLQPHVQA